MGTNKKEPDDIHVDLNAIREALDSAEEKVEIVIERTKKNTISVTISSDPPGVDIDDDLESSSLEELCTKLSQAETALAELEEDEPDEDDEDAYEEWEEKCRRIEDLIDEIEDRLSALEELEDGSQGE